MRCFSNTQTKQNGLPQCADEKNPEIIIHKLCFRSITFYDEPQEFVCDCRFKL